MAYPERLHLSDPTDNSNLLSLSDLRSRIENNGFLFAPLPDSMGEITAENIVEPMKDSAAQALSDLELVRAPEKITLEHLEGGMIVLMVEELQQRYGGAFSPRIAQLIADAVDQVLAQLQQDEHERERHEQEELEQMLAGVVVSWAK